MRNFNKQQICTLEMSNLLDVNISIFIFTVFSPVD